MRFKNKPTQPSHPSRKISAVSAIAFVMSVSGLSLALTSLPAMAQETKVQENKAPASQPVTETSADLLSLFREAAQNDPTYNAAKAAMLAGGESFWQGLSVLLPQVNGTWSTSKTDLNYVNSTGSNKQFSSNGWNVKLTQPLFNWAKFETFRQGDLNAQLAKVQFAQAEQDLVLRVTQAYFAVLTALDNVELYKNKKVLISQQLEQAKRNFEVGTATITDTNEAQSRYDLVIAQEIAAVSDLDIKRSALEQIIGRPLGSIKTLNTTAKIDSVVGEKKAKGKKKVVINKEASQANLAAAITMPPGQTMDDWVKQAEEVNYGVAAAQLNQDVARSNLRGAIAGHAPYVDLVGSRGYTNQTGTATLGPSQYYNSTGTIQLTIPLFAGGYTQSVVRQNAELLNQASYNYEFAKRSAIQNTRQAYLGFVNGLAQVKAYEAAEVSALSSLDSNKLGYEVGVRINIDVLNAQDQLFTTRASLYKARYDTIINGLTLKAQAAVLSDEDLQAVNALLK